MDALHGPDGGITMDFSKPRVAIYYDVLPQTGFRNDGAPLFISLNLRKLINGDTVEQLNRDGMGDGGNVVHLSPINPTSQHGKFDLNVLVDYGEDGLGIPLDWEIPHPNVYWAFDTHVTEKGYRYRLERAKQFDHVFLCHKAQIPLFIRDGIPEEKIHYLPVAAEPEAYSPHSIMKKYNWGFIGHLNSEHRIDLMQRFIDEFGLGDGKGYMGWRMPQAQSWNVLNDAAKKFSMCRLIINDSLRNDLNMRTFEAMATGTCLLTQENEPLLELFRDGTHLLTFKTIEEAVKKARWILKDHGAREEISKTGLKEVLDKHTYHHRTLEILKTSLRWEPKGDLVKC